MNTEEQLHKLDSYESPFHSKIGGELKAESIRTFQINVGKLCNQACLHCHVDAGPKRTENMDRETIDLCLDIIRQLPEVETVDLTGGAPEMNSEFRYFVTELRKLGKHVIDRCNLTILEEPGYEYLYDFLRDNQVEIVASLPHYAADRTDRQRGRGVFDASIIALRKLNEVGYGGDLPLSLVYNPAGFFLSSDQDQLKREFQENLRRDFGIEFNNLYAINNIPINRFLKTLVDREKYEDYMEMLVNAFNPQTVEGLMCRHQISVSYDGQVYDCDFNQMLELEALPFGHIRDFNYESFVNRNVRTSAHCYGCTAGGGSSCGGEIVAKDVAAKA